MTDKHKEPFKLFNVIIVHDVYCVAETVEDARATIQNAIREGQLNSSQSSGHEINASPVRQAWRDEKPFVGETVSDADFDRIKGKTTQEVHDMLTKHPVAAAKALAGKK